MCKERIGDNYTLIDECLIEPARNETNKHSAHWDRAFQLDCKILQTCVDLMHMLSGWKQPNPGSRNASTIVLGRRCQAVQQELRNRTGGRMSLRSQLPELLPTETRGSVSNFFLNCRNMSSSESKSPTCCRGTEDHGEGALNLEASRSWW